MNDPNPTPCEEHAPGAMPEIFQLIEDLEKRFRQFQGYTLREARLTPPQYFILSLLAEKDGRPFKELADELACSRATITGIVDTMEKKELVLRGPNLVDRRSLRLTLTEKGRALLQATPGLEKTFGSCCCDALPPDEARQLSRLLQKLSASLPF